MAFRLMPAESSGISPYHMLFSWDMKLPFDLNLEAKANIGKQAQECNAQWFQNLQIAKDTAQQNIQRSQSDYKRYYDNSARPHVFQLGDLVLLRNNTITKG